MAKKKKDQLSVSGFISAIMKNRSQHAAMAKAREKEAAKHAPEQPPAEPKPKDTRTPEQIRADVDATRESLVRTVEGIKYDIDVPARAKDLRDRVAAKIPAEWRGEPRATIISASVFAAGIGAIVWGTVARLKR